MKVLKAKRPCAAQDPSTCRYHGAYVRLEKAVAGKDFEGYEQARVQIENNEDRKVAEGTDVYGASGESFDSVTEKEATRAYDHISARLWREGEPPISHYPMRAVNDNWDEDSVESISYLVHHTEAHLAEEKANVKTKADALRFQAKNHFMRHTLRLVMNSQNHQKDGTISVPEKRVVGVIEGKLGSSLETSKSLSKMGKTRFFRRTPLDITTEIKENAKANSYKFFMNTLANSYDDEKWGTYTPQKAAASN